MGSGSTTHFPENSCATHLLLKLPLCCMLRGLPVCVVKAEHAAHDPDSWARSHTQWAKDGQLGSWSPGSRPLPWRSAAPCGPWASAPPAHPAPPPPAAARTRSGCTPSAATAACLRARVTVISWDVLVILQHLTALLPLLPSRCRSCFPCLLRLVKHSNLHLRGSDDVDSVLC